MNEIFCKQSPIAEMQKGIILANYQKSFSVNENYQTEAELEDEMIKNLISQGYERIKINSVEDLYSNLKNQIEKLNSVEFSSEEWHRFLNEYLDTPNDTLIEKTRKVQEDYIHDFIFDDGHLENIKIIDKKNIHNNFLQVTNQVVQKGKYENRYDVTILINGLPMVQIELKRRGVNLQEAFNQIHRYSKESFNSENSLYKYIQIFIISNGTYTRYFANTTAQNKNHYEFTCEWADAGNKVIHDLEDFTATFLEKRVLLEVLTKYCVFDTNNTLLVMRPYQIAATERILQKIYSSYQNKKSGTIEAGGFIWHTTGSGKTLTSFKTAKLATELNYIDKVFFVVDRKDLDYQTMQEYERFRPGSVNGSKNTKELKRNIEKDDDRIVVTTIQKLNEFIKGYPEHEVFKKHCVLIYDECHRSQFGETQKNIRKYFKHYYQFGFTGTPIFPENASGSETTGGIFGKQLHSYVITDAIRDGKVLKFKVDYHNVNLSFKEAETEKDDEKLKKLENKLLISPNRISEIAKHILKVYNVKTHRNELYNIKQRRVNGFNAMLAVQSIEAAKFYYEEFKKQQSNLPEEKKLKIATIFSFSANEEQKALGEIAEEEFETELMDLSSKEFLEKAIEDYNKTFATNFSVGGKEFQNYYKDLSEKVKNKEIDLLIVVGMFLTGFDAPALNTLFVDKNLKYHGLIQAFSRTNRIFNKIKTFGNIVCFRSLEENTKEAIKMFGDENSINIILEKSYNDYLYGFTEEETGKKKEGYIDLCNEILEKFPEPTEIILDSDKKEFAKLFGELLKTENILKNFDEFESFEKIITDRKMQDMKSVYVDIREEVLKKKNSSDIFENPEINFSDIEFQIELLKTDEINLDYILALIFEKAKEHEDRDVLKNEIRRVIRSSLGTRAKEELIMEFINRTDLIKLKKKEDVLESFYKYAREEKENKITELTENEKLKEDSKRFIEKSINKGFVDLAGAELDNLLPPTSRRKGAREAKKQSIFEKIQKLVDIFIGI